jgi:hypothetical protein
MASFSGPEKCRRVLLMRNLRPGNANPNGGFFQIHLTQNKTTLDAMLIERPRRRILRNAAAGGEG